MKILYVIGFVLGLWTGQALAMTQVECMQGWAMPQRQPLPEPIEGILKTIPAQIINALKWAIDAEILNPAYQRELKLYKRLTDTCRIVATQDQELAHLRSVPKP